jgi:hypothetical protein
MPTSLKAISATALIGFGLSLSSPAHAGWCGWGCGWGSALAGFGVGAIVGSTIAAPPAYAVPPPTPYHYGPAAYGPYDGPAGYGPPDYNGGPAAYHGQAGYGPPDHDGQGGYGPPDYNGGPPAYHGQAGHGPPNYDGQGGYGLPPRTPSGYGNRPYPPSNTPPHVTADAQRPVASRSTTAKTGVITTSKEKMEAKFKYAEAKAKRDGVDSLTKEDVEGLSPEQMKQLRGY